MRRRRGSGRRRATVLAMEDDPADKGELDLLTIGLVVFFVAVIGTVAVMLALTIL